MSELDLGIKNFVERAVVFTDPQKAVTEYFVSKQHDKGIRKYPEWDRPRVCPETEVVRSHQELTKVNKALRAKWAERDAKRENMDEQWKEMRQQELLLRDSFIKFNKFIKENQEKRDRAVNKISEERERQLTRKKEIAALTGKLDYMTGIRERMKKHVGLYKKYQNYLEKVISETSEFQSINEIFNRYETLIEAKVVLAEHQDKSLKALEETGTEIHHMTEAKSQMLMGLNNKLAQLQSRQDKAKAQALQWETVLARIKSSSAAKNLELAQLKTCCWNIYQQVCKKKGIPTTIARDNTEQQLLHIQRTIQELKRVIKVAKKHMAKEEKAQSTE